MEYIWIPYIWFLLGYLKEAFLTALTLPQLGRKRGETRGVATSNKFFLTPEFFVGVDENARQGTIFPYKHFKIKMTPNSTFAQA